MDTLITYSTSTEAAPVAGRPELRIEGFGNIASAHIKLAPLTILVGRNNTGKSYVASLLWAVQSFAWLAARGGEAGELRAPEWLRAEIKGAMEKGDGASVTVTAQRAIRTVNAWLANAKSDVVRELMSFDKASIKALSLKLSGQVSLTLTNKLPKFAREFMKPDGERLAWYFNWSPDDAPETDQFKWMMLSHYEDERDLSEALLCYCISILIHRRLEASARSAVYVPAARTGLMLSLRSLYFSLIDNFALTCDRGDR